MKLKILILFFKMFKKLKKEMSYFKEYFLKEIIAYKIKMSDLEINDVEVVDFDMVDSNIIDYILEYDETRTGFKIHIFNDKIYDEFNDKTLNNDVLDIGDLYRVDCYYDFYDKKLYINGIREEEKI